MLKSHILAHLYFIIPGYKPIILSLLSAIERNTLYGSSENSVFPSRLQQLYHFYVPAESEALSHFACLKGNKKTRWPQSVATVLSEVSVPFVTSQWADVCSHLFNTNLKSGASKRIKERMDFSISRDHFLRPHLQMFEAEEDGAITEMELAVILKTALGVARLSVSHLFAAIDVGDTGKITFGKWNEINPGCSLSFPHELLFSHF